MIKPILMNFPMPIFTDRLVIRPPQIGEGAAVNQAILETYDSLKETMPWAKTPQSIDDTEEVVRRAAANWILKDNIEPYLPLFIFDRDGGVFLGSTGYHHMDWAVPALEIGYWLRSRHQRHGIMTETVNAITRYAFLELKAQRTEIRCDIQNQKSRQVAERVGYHLEATLKNNRVGLVSKLLSSTLVYACHSADELPDLAVKW